MWNGIFYLSKIQTKVILHFKFVAVLSRYCVLFAELNAELRLPEPGNENKLKQNKQQYFKEYQYQCRKKLIQILIYMLIDQSRNLNYEHPFYVWNFFLNSLYYEENGIKFYFQIKQFWEICIFITIRTWQSYYFEVNIT